MEVREHKLTVGAPVSALRFSNAERILFACGDRTLRTFSAVRGQIENEVAVQSLTRIAAFSQDGKLLATAGRSGIPIVDTQGGTQRLSLTTVSMARSLAFSSSGHLLAAGLINKTLCIWDLTKGSQLHTVPIGVAPASHLVFSPDERFLTVTSPDTDVRVFDVRSGELQGRIDQFLMAMSAVEYSPRGELLALGGADQSIYLLDATLRVIRQWKHPESVRSIAFSPDGRRLLSGGGDAADFLRPGHLCLWEVANGQLLWTGEASSGTLAVAFSPDGRSFVSLPLGDPSMWTIAA